jgi:glucosamine 6-phosphate synthetase-like amidotransferase/phosphosugar isomerase protein
VCGIAGSFDLDSGWECYRDNLKRGYYSSSVTIIGENGINIIKKSGQLDYNEIPKNGIYYLFHSRGPTVETNGFKWDENHPFIYGRFVVAHNGIIENYKQLAVENFTVDSQIIPFLINNQINKNMISCPKIGIHTVLETLQGTFACWILDTVEWDVYLIRHDVTLFSKGGVFSTFSSSKLNGFKDVQQDTLFRINIKSKTIDVIGQIKPSKKMKYFIPCQTD